MRAVVRGLDRNSRETMAEVVFFARARMFHFSTEIVSQCVKLSRTTILDEVQRSSLLSTTSYFKAHASQTGNPYPLSRGAERFLPVQRASVASEVVQESATVTPGFFVTGDQ